MSDPNEGVPEPWWLSDAGDETVLWSGRRHRLNAVEMAARYAAMPLVLAAMMFMLPRDVVDPPLSYAPAALVVIAAVGAAWIWYRMGRVRYALTDEAIYLRFGGKYGTDRTPLSEIEVAERTDSFFSNVIDIGGVTLWGDDEDEPEVRLGGLREPETVLRHLGDHARTR